VTNSHAKVAAFQQAVLLCSRRTFFCMDASKLGRATPHRVTDWTKNVALITDGLALRLAAAGVVLPAGQLVSAR